MKPNEVLKNKRDKPIPVITSVERQRSSINILHVDRVMITNKNTSIIAFAR